jgi:hypothetical protein
MLREIASDERDADTNLFGTQSNLQLRDADLRILSNGIFGKSALQAWEIFVSIPDFLIHKKKETRIKRTPSPLRIDGLSAFLSPPVGLHFLN